MRGKLVTELLFAGWGQKLMRRRNWRVLCPWCFNADLVALMIMFGLTRYNILQKIFHDICEYRCGGYEACRGTPLSRYRRMIITKFGQLNCS